MNNYPYNNMPMPRRMPSTNRPPNMPPMNMPMQVSCIDPFVVDTLMSIIGKKIIVETVRGSIQGKLADVKPDHIVLKEVCGGDSVFFIRIQEIVHIMPNID
ncbi:YuzF family protein [Caldisalinibacter kiritimatiensis]|uniref:DUF2642 domain-containing protein n=1 Tax=Caldisalinibacter kiritimatiensis TaxID=1304284 RepID=R1AS61_9FIRM|nr:YuzF family protein [Caldisalinibacter kiritimatiensis]EOC99476.1 hypothetical protein L21TH_2481 [Caldisalinibacter kiritimatiensis]